MRSSDADNNSHFDLFDHHHYRELTFTSDIFTHNNTNNTITLNYLLVSGFLAV